jgi:peptidoglycan/xylan/chitin deacetylase (PgdA/CDA1 family)
MKSLAYRLLSRSGVCGPLSHLVAGRLQILCYHGFSFLDEHRFRSKLFMTPALLEQRLAWLAKNRYAVLRLTEALQRLRAGRIGRREIVLTIDDGFHSVFALAAPLLRAYRMPATIYVTTYYVTHQNPIFRLALQYLAWKSRHAEVDISGLVAPLSGTMPLHGAGAAERLESLYDAAERDCDEMERVRIAREFGERVDVDYDELARSRRMSLMSIDELKTLRADGFDIQLHTHRHRLPPVEADMRAEIAENRAVLSTLTESPLEHLCYPSGLWCASQWPGLSALGIASATTCVPGFNTTNTPLLGLHRFLDGQDIAMEEFEVEMAGVKDLFRRSRRLLRNGASHPRVYPYA